MQNDSFCLSDLNKELTLLAQPSFVQHKSEIEQIILNYVKALTIYTPPVFFQKLFINWVDDSVKFRVTVLCADEDKLDLFTSRLQKMVLADLPKQIIANLDTFCEHSLQNRISLNESKFVSKPYDKHKPAYIAAFGFLRHNKPFLIGKVFLIPFCDLSAFGLYFVDS